MSSSQPERQPTNSIELKPGSRVHMMGICGVAMASLAGLLKDRGYIVTGSDQNVYPPMSTQLEQLGIPIMDGYRAENLEKARPDWVIVGNVIGRANLEAQALLASDIPFSSLPAALGELVIKGHHSVVVSGTHGKTTTTSMVAWVMDQHGLEPGYLIGGIPKNFEKSYRSPQGAWFVIEGDEYDTAFFDKVPKFIHYRPNSVILTSVEFDHADIYSDLQQVMEAFSRLLKLVPESGLLVASAEDPNIQRLLVQERSLLSRDGRRLVTFGLTEGDYRAQQIRTTSSGVEFEVVRAGKPPTPVRLRMIGDYNIKNALATFALVECLGLDIARAVDSFGNFSGVKRRQEIIGCPKGITIIEDFAHHPTAVRQTIEAVQKRFSSAKVYSVLELRSATSRRRVFQEEYVEALDCAQSVLLPPAFNQDQISLDQRFSVEKLISDLKARGVDVKLCSNTEQIVSELKSKAQPGDVVLIMSNGGFDGIYVKLLSALS